MKEGKKPGKKNRKEGEREEERKRYKRERERRKMETEDVEKVREKEKDIKRERDVGHVQQQCMYHNDNTFFGLFLVSPPSFSFFFFLVKFVQKEMPPRHVFNSHVLRRFFPSFFSFLRDPVTRWTLFLR